MKTDNPYLEKLHEAYRNNDVENIALYNKLAQDFTAELMIKVNDKQKEIQQKIDMVKPRQLMNLHQTKRQYKELIKTYRETVALIRQISALKKDIRENYIKKFERKKDDSGKGYVQGKI